MNTLFKTVHVPGNYERALEILADSRASPKTLEQWNLTQVSCLVSNRFLVIALRVRNVVFSMALVSEKLCWYVPTGEDSGKSSGAGVRSIKAST